MEEKKAKQERIITYVLLAVLILWPLFFVNKGIDVRDSASYLTKYRYIFQKGIKVNEIHYFLGELFGGIIYQLAPTHKVLCLNIASAAVYVISSLLTYRLLDGFLSKPVRMLCALTGSLYAITWVRMLNWNAWTSLWLSVGLLILFAGLKDGNRKLYLAAGFVLGINTYFRMPNILFLAMIVVIFWKEILDMVREADGRISKIFTGGNVLCLIKAGLPFFLGAAAAGIVGLLLGCAVLGPDVVMDDLSMLTSVGSGANEGNTHSITTGIYLFLLGMRDGALEWVVYLAGMLVIVGFTYLLRKWHMKGNLLLIDMIIAVLWGLEMGIRENVLFAHQWLAFAAVVFGILGAFYWSRKDSRLSCLCVAAVIVEGFITIGTDTGVNFYRVYMALPLGVVTILFLKYAKERETLALEAMKDTGAGAVSSGAASSYRSSYVSDVCRFAALFTMSLVLVSGIRYAATYVYHDADNSQLTCEIDNPLYAGIKTSPQRAESLNKLMEYLAPYEAEGDKLLQIGCFNIGCVLTDMEPFYNSSWPDLEYLPMAEFDEGLDEAIESGDLPVLLLGTAEESGMNWNPTKYKKIKELGESSLYRTLYVDELYTIYVPAEE